MSISDFLEKNKANFDRRSRELTHLGLKLTPVIFEPTQAEFSAIRAAEEKLLGGFRADGELLRAEMDAANKEEDKIALSDIEQRLAIMTNDRQEAFDTFKAMVALQSLGEFDRQPTDSEVEDIQSFYSSEVIHEIYKSLLSFSQLDKTLDEIKKS